MTLKEFANVNSLYRDLSTKRELEWHEYMRRVIDKLGIDNIKRYIPYDIEYLMEKIKSDIHLNNTGIERWNVAAGFMSVVDRKTGSQYYKPIPYGIPNLFLANGITTFSPADGVCVLKEAARILCEVD